MSRLDKLRHDPKAFIVDAWAKRFGVFALPIDKLLDEERAVRAARDLGPEVRFVYFPWIEGHGDALMRHIDAPELSIRPLLLFSAGAGRRERAGRQRAINLRPDRYRESAARVLRALPSSVAAVLFSMDWHPSMRQLVFACKEVGLPTVLIPHEGMFADQNRYYVDITTGVDCPLCDVTLAWGDQQARIFAERGYPRERIVVTGAPKFDVYHGFQSRLSPEDFARVYGWAEPRPLVVFACQPLDSQHQTYLARSRQQAAIRDLAQYCEQHQARLLIREPPNGDDVLSKCRAWLSRQAHVRLDRSPGYLTPPEDTLANASVVCSINSTMLFEAALLRKPAISSMYVEFTSTWERLGGAVARDRDQLIQLLDRALAGGAEPFDVGPGSAFAREYSTGVFDGQAKARISMKLRELSEQAPALYRAFDVDGLFADTRPKLTRRGRVGYHARPSSLVQHVPAMLGCRELIQVKTLGQASGMDGLAYWGSLGRSKAKRAVEGFSLQLGTPRLILEDGFIRSVEIGLSGTPTLSLLLDRRAPYYDARQPTSLEDHLNGDFELTWEQRVRARRAMELITEHRISKYNHAPERRLTGVTDGVLVIDQRRGDVSVEAGLGSEAGFGAMLEAARKENPSRPILVKRHPDALSGAKTAYYSNAFLRKYAHLSDVTLVDFEVNPHALFDVCAKAYVMTSQMGFEARLRGLEVHCFGLPFYAGWGITSDRQVCPRRRRRRSVEELFFAAYIQFARYFDPKTGRSCELEELIEYIATARAARAVR